MRRRRQSGPVEQNGDGTFTLNLGEYEREVLTGFARQLKDLVTGDTDDPRVRRLFPAAYSNDPAADAEYQKFMREELVESKVATIDQVMSLLESGAVFGPVDMTRLMLTVNNLRLVIGTLLDVTDDGAEPEFEDEDDPLAAQWQLYGWLGWFLEWIVDAQSGE